MRDAFEFLSDQSLSRQVPQPQLDLFEGGGQSQPLWQSQEELRLSLFTINTRMYI